MLVVTTIGIAFITVGELIYDASLKDADVETGSYILATINLPALILSV